MDHSFKVLESGHSDPYHKARLLASRNPDGGHWLHTWSISACGSRLDDEAVRVAIGLRLGIDLCEEHDCTVVSRFTEWAAMGCRAVEVKAGYHDMMPPTTSFNAPSQRYRSPHRKNKEA